MEGFQSIIWVHSVKKCESVSKSPPQNAKKLPNHWGNSGILKKKEAGALKTMLKIYVTTLKAGIQGIWGKKLLTRQWQLEYEYLICNRLKLDCWKLDKKCIIGKN